ncbi:unnamed protein product, partial [Soboliphyme baturini]|uniref:DPPIV_N domain-containing protein n=1 Tax=Soboliphyme baturini TaxID=241478 RepID=A0A183J452_9BILA
VFRPDHTPVKLWYIWWEDTIWIEEIPHEGHYKIIQIIRSASKPIQQSLMHALPLQEEFNEIENVFLPVSHEMKYGYISHRKEKTLHKVDLHSLRVISQVSLAPYDCHPLSLAFVEKVGLVVIQCGQSNISQPDSQLILDYLSDTVLSFDTGIHGIPTVSASNQYIVSVEPTLGRFFVQKVNSKEVTSMHFIDEYLPLSAWTTDFSTTNNVLLFGISSFSEQLVKVNITSKEVS